MSVITDTASTVASQLVSQLAPALLLVLGALLTLVVSVYAFLKVSALFSGKGSGDVAYKMGRIFGSLVHEHEYNRYRQQRERRENRSEMHRNFARRYNRNR